MGSASRIDVKHWKGPAKRNGGPIFVDDTRWAEIVGSRVCVSSSSPAIQELCELGREEECAPALLEYDAHKLKNVIEVENLVSAAAGQVFAFCAREWQDRSDGMGAMLTKVVLYAAQEHRPPAAEELAGNVVPDTRSEDELKASGRGSAGGERPEPLCSDRIITVLKHSLLDYGICLDLAISYDWSKIASAVHVDGQHLRIIVWSASLADFDQQVYTHSRIPADILWREHKVLDEYQYEIRGENATLEFCPWSSDAIAVLYDGVVSILIVETLPESEAVVSLADSLLPEGQKAASFTWGNMNEKGIYVGTVDGQLLFFEADEIINMKLEKDADQTLQGFSEDSQDGLMISPRYEPTAISFVRMNGQVSCLTVNRYYVVAGSSTGELWVFESSHGRSKPGSKSADKGEIALSYAARASPFGITRILFSPENYENMLSQDDQGNKFWLRLKQSEGSESRDLAKWLQDLPPESLGENVPDSRNTKSSKNDFASFTVEHQGQSLLRPMLQSGRKLTLSAVISLQSVVKASCHQVVGTSFIGSSKTRVCLFADCQGEIKAVSQEYKALNVLSVGTSISAFAALENGIAAFGTPSGEIRICKFLDSELMLLERPASIWTGKIGDEPIGLLEWLPENGMLVASSRGSKLSFIATGLNSHGGGTFRPSFLGAFSTGCLVTSMAWMAKKNQLFLSGIKLDGQGNIPHSNGGQDTCGLLIACLIHSDDAAQNLRSENTPNGEYQPQSIHRTQAQRAPLRKIEAMQIQGEDSLIALTFDGEIIRLTPLPSKQPVLNFTEQVIVSSEMRVPGKVLDFAITENKPLEAYTISTLQEDGYLRLYSWDGSSSAKAHQSPPQECGAIQIASSISGGVERVSCYGKVLACSSGSGMTTLLECPALPDPEESSLSIPPAIDVQVGSDVEKSRETYDQADGKASEAIDEGGDGVGDSLTTKNSGVVRTRLSEIKSVFQSILRNNDAAEELDKLSRLELLVDHEAYDAQNRICKDKVEKLEKDIALQNLRRKLEFQRIKSLAWDSMDVRIQSIVGINNTSLSVDDIPVEKGTDTSQAKCVLFLRCIEAREEMWQMAEADPSKPGGSKSYPGNRKDEHDDQNVEHEKSSSTLRGESSHAEDNNGIMSLDGHDADDAKDSSRSAMSNDDILTDFEEGLRSPILACYSHVKMKTSYKKRAQAKILQLEHEKIREEYNKHFFSLAQRKMNDLDRLKDIRERIQEIKGELGLAGEEDEQERRWAVVIRALQTRLSMELHPSEIPDDTIKVTNEDFQSRGLKPENRKDAEDDKDESRQEDGSGQQYERGLIDMMGGKLESKDNGKGLAEDIPKPEWLDSVNKKDMTQDQIKELKEYEAKVKELEEERESYRRSLEQELKKCKSDSANIISNFNSALTDLMSKYRATLISKKENEVERTRIWERVFAQNKLETGKGAQLSQVIDKLKLHRGLTSARVSCCKGEIEKLRSEQEKLVSSDKQIDRQFRRELQETSGENQPTADGLYRIFKKRFTVEGPGINRQSSGISLKHSNSISQFSIDDTWSTYLKELESSFSRHQDSKVDKMLSPYKRPRADIPSVVDTEKEQSAVTVSTPRPESVDDALWKSSLDHRNRKIHSEVKIQIASAKLNAKLRQFTRVKSLDEHFNTGIKLLLKARNQVQDNCEKNRVDLDLSLKLKQGQVEIDWPRNMTNRVPSAISEDTILLSRQSVEDVNKVVLKRDNSNFQIIEAIIDFRKGIYQDIWANKALSMRIFNGVEKIKDLHLTRTTRVIQEFLKSGEDKSVREAAEIESQIKKKRVIHQKKLKEQELRLQKIDALILERVRSTAAFSALVHEESSKDMEISRIKDRRAEQSKSNYLRMNSIATLRKLQDIAKVQREEKGILLQEKSRLMRKVYPSFQSEELLAEEASKGMEEPLSEVYSIRSLSSYHSTLPKHKSRQSNRSRSSVLT